jgi:hypothetical protein
MSDYILRCIYLENDYKIDLLKNRAPTIVFNEHLLSNIHKLFNDDNEIWQPIQLIDFLASFNGNGNMIKLIDNKQSLFCLLLSEIEEKRNKDVCPNMNNWVEKTFGIKDYKSQKRDNSKEGSEAWKKKQSFKLKISAHVTK